MRDFATTALGIDELVVLAVDRHGAMFPWLQCPAINQTHIVPNMTALSNLNEEELHSLQAILLTFDQSDSCIKEHLRSLWPLYVLLYALVALSGAAGSVYMIGTIIAETSCRRFINFLLFNLCLSDLFKGIVVLPLSLFVLSLAHWRLGAWLCYVSPLVQILPVVVTMLTYVLIAFERYFLVFRPSGRDGGSAGRMVHLAVVSGAWVSCICLILPLKSSVRYYDLALYFGGSVDGYGLCAISYDVNTKEINCALFIVLFAIPLAFITYLMTKTNQELAARLRSEDPIRLDRLDRSPLDPTNLQAVPLVAGLRQAYSQSAGGLRKGASKDRDKVTRRSFLSYIDHERTQLALLLRVNRCICIMVALFALCWTPLECVMLICYIIPETPETSTTVDVLFLVFTLMGLLSSVANSALLVYQKKSVHTVLHTGIRLLRRLSSIDGRRRRSRSENDLTDDT